MAPRCEIKFDNNPLGIYHAGQTLSGRVELHLDKPKTVNAFTLVISGCAEIEWSEDDNDKRDTYRGKEELLHAEIALVAQSKGSAIEIPVGTHVYNFTCELPQHLPTSFEGNYGKIRYLVCATLDRPWKFNQTCKVAFTVLKPVDLNQDPSAGQPKRVELSKTFCCWPCRTRPLFITVETPATGFVPGQKIPILVVLDNSSSVAVHGVKCSLDRTESYISQSPYEKTKTVDKTLASLSTAVVNDKHARLTQQLEIPSIAPTGKCSVLAIDYELNINIQVESCRVNPRIKIPIIIGTVPLLTATSSSRSNLMMGVNANYGSFDECPQPTAPPAPATFDGALPPSYEEAMHGTVVNVNDEPHAIGFQPYVPRYPVFKFDSKVKL